MADEDATRVEQLRREIEQSRKALSEAEWDSHHYQDRCSTERIINMGLQTQVQNQVDHIDALVRRSRDLHANLMDERGVVQDLRVEIEVSKTAARAVLRDVWKIVDDHTGLLRARPIYDQVRQDWWAFRAQLRRVIEDVGVALPAEEDS